MPDYDVYDVIVVGAGAGGTILASRIAENGVNPSTGERLKVGLFEGGPYYLKGGPLRPGYGDPWRRQVITNIRSDETEPPRWEYDSFNVKAVGGCSLHWGTNVILPISRDYSNWQRETGVDWSEEKFKEAIAEAMRMYQVYHLPGQESQPLDVEKCIEEAVKRFHNLPLQKATKKSKGGQMVEDAARALGVKLDLPLYPGEIANAGNARINDLNSGVGYERFSKLDSRVNGLFYLKLIGEPNGLEVIPDAEVDRVIIEKKGTSFVAKGIIYTRNGQTREARAPRVILACGPNGTPLVLYRSGYGPKDFLGDKLLVENDNVGRHLDGDMNPGQGLNIQMTFGEDIHGGGGSATKFLVHDEGGYNRLNLSGIGSAGGEPDLVALFPVAPDFGWEHRAYMETAKKRLGTMGFSMSCLKWDKGRIGLKGQHLYRKDDPKILGVILKGWAIAQEIVRKLDPQPIKVDDAPPKSFSIYHEMGTCRAGVSKKNSVVTPEFDCHDIENLMIGSAAVIPTGNYTLAMMPTLVVNCYAWRKMVANHFSRGAAPLKL